jgi:hypothetical protein
LSIFALFSVLLPKTVVLVLPMKRAVAQKGVRVGVKPPSDTQSS